MFGRDHACLCVCVCVSVICMFFENHMYIWILNYELYVWDMMKARMMLGLNPGSKKQEYIHV